MRVRNSVLTATAALFLTGGSPAFGQAPGTVLDGAYTEAQAARGQEVAQICARCHGSTLGGGSRPPALVGSSFQNKWASGTLAAPFDFIRRNMPRNAPGSLTLQQYADVLAYLLQQTGYPAGAAELAPDAAALGAIAMARLP